MSCTFRTWLNEKNSWMPMGNTTTDLNLKSIQLVRKLSCWADVVQIARAMHTRVRNASAVCCKNIRCNQRLSFQVLPSSQISLHGPLQPSAYEKMIQWSRYRNRLSSHPCSAVRNAKREWFLTSSMPNWHPRSEWKIVSRGVIVRWNNARSRTLATTSPVKLLLKT